MKAISIKQPFASLIAMGIKGIENRTWRCPEKYIGQRVIIHASTNPITPNQFCHYIEELDCENLELQKIIRDNNFSKTCFDSLPNSAIIGSVEIANCVINHPSIWAEQTDNYTIGMNPKLHKEITGDKVTYNWVLANPILFDEPILGVKGRLGFWDFELNK